MRVRELIEKLQEMPLDSEVVVRDPELDHLSGVWHVEDLRRVYLSPRNSFSTITSFVHKDGDGVLLTL